MFSFFKCKHPADRLVVAKDATIVQHNADFEYVDYHLLCTNCNSEVTIKYAKLIGGVEGFLSRKSKSTL